MTAKTDIFAEAREKYRIPELWQALGLPGEPKSSCKSPFREDRAPSFSIFDDGRAWTDHATGEGGDVISFLCKALGVDHREARDWFGERLGIDYLDHFPVKPRTASKTPPQPAKKIQWPGELIEGTPETWQAFAMVRGYTYPAVHAMVQTGILRFIKIDGLKCYVVTDPALRSAEIRRLDGKTFGAHKAFPLPGVDKSWLVGGDYLEAPNVIITEGATDFLTCFDMLSRYVRSGGINSWTPLALLGAGCKSLHPDLAAAMRGRHARLVPDADPAGKKMANHWTSLLNSNGCSVDVVELSDGTDLSDNLNTIQPLDLFSK
jgi:hypothetical protein